MTAKQEWLERIELAFQRGYRDGYDEQPRLSRLKVARLFLTSVYKIDESDCLLAVYRLGFRVGEDQLIAEIRDAK